MGSYLDKRQIKIEAHGKIKGARQADQQHGACSSPAADGSRHTPVDREKDCILIYSLRQTMGGTMSKTLTLRLDEPVYRLFKTVAERENRPISNFIETAVMRFVQEHETVDEFEMTEIRGNTELNRSLKRGHRDAKDRSGTFI